VVGAVQYVVVSAVLEELQFVLQSALLMDRFLLLMLVQ
jgi:hypothetical protein